MVEDIVATEEPKRFPFESDEPCGPGWSDEDPGERNRDPVGSEGADVGAARLRRRGDVIGVLAGIAVVAVGLAAWFALSAHRVRHSGPIENTALVDAEATTSVVDQVGRAIRTSFSYDYTNIDRTQRAARQALTGRAVAQYEELFGRTKQQAAAEQMVLTTAVRSVGVMELRANDARLLVFVDRQIIRTASNQHESASGQLVVTAERAGNTWKINDIQVL